MFAIVTILVLRHYLCFTSVPMLKVLSKYITYIRQLLAQTFLENQDQNFIQKMICNYVTILNITGMFLSGLELQDTCENTIMYIIKTCFNTSQN